MVYRQKGGDYDIFWRHVAKGAADECWPWTACRTPLGYGKTVRHGRSLKAHRRAYEATHGSIPDGLYVLHTCDNPPCCNPSHLWLGTAADNMQDCISKGRHPHPSQRLTAEQVEEIRQGHAAGGVSYTELAKRYGIAVGHVGQIVRREVWK